MVAVGPEEPCDSGWAWGLPLSAPPPATPSVQPVTWREPRALRAGLPPELLLGGRAVQRVLQLCLQRFQLLSQVPLLLLGLVSRGPF